MIKGLRKLDVITLFAEDLAATKAFYADVFGLEVVYENQDSAVVKFDNLMINLLDAAKAPELLTPSTVGGAGNDPRALFTIEVTDANAVAAELEQHGVRLLNGPVDRPWGRRTAAFADPAGNVWEIAQILEN
ncbi:VOC family protein [Streptomyces sp. NPDC005385]|uniref:VOC family protein n=1 Tax=Streptomyces sp. NPDC005385 TaxID=3157039 RepID=UPI0033BB521C